MDKTLLSPLSGFRDYDRPTKDRLVGKLRNIFRTFNFQPLETPSIERQELLLSNYGEEAQKLLYLFEDQGERKVGLRYDFTMPLSRYVANRINELPLPYRRYEIGNSWRAERAQKGRLRQFTQADVDIVGVASIGAELELLEVIAQFEQQIGLGLTYLINDRRLVSQALTKLGIKAEKEQKLLQLLDKRRKITPEEFQQQLTNLGLSDVECRRIVGYFARTGQEAWAELKELLGESQAVDELERILSQADSLKLNVEFDPGMVRGLDYYTGFIIEAVSEDYPSSLIGGGRYDSLVESLIGQKLPAVGISFGVDRIVDLMDSRGLELDEEEAIFVTALPETMTAVRQWVNQLRAQGKVVELYPDESVDLGKQLKYVDKRGFSSVVLPFESEWQDGKIVVKDLATGRQETVLIKEIGSNG